MEYQADINSKEDYLRQFLSGFSILTIEFILTPRSKINLGIDEMKGDRWRGGLGSALRGLVCKQRGADCLHCDFKQDCFYFQNFEIDKPHPYIIQPALDSKDYYEPDEEIRLNFTLIGDAIRHLYVFIKAMEHLGINGIGKGRGRFYINDASTKALFDLKDIFNYKKRQMGHITVELLTHLKLKDTETGIHYSDISFKTFFKHLIKRIINLNNLYCDGMDFDRDKVETESRRLQSLAESIKTDSYTEWKDYRRFSSRQNKSMKIGGLIGLIKLSGDLSPFYPYLKIGEVIGVGQHTTSGFGRYKLMQTH